MNHREHRRKDKQASNKVAGTVGQQAVPPGTVSTALTAAVRAYQAGELRRAGSRCKEILELDPHNADALHLLGVVMTRMGKKELAVDFIRKAVAISPDLAEAHANLGVLLRDLGRAAEAVASCRKAIALQPKKAEAHGNLGVALRDQGKLDEAVVALHKAVAIRPDFAEAYRNLGVVLYDQGRLDQALAACKEAIRLAPDHAGAHINVGNVLLDQNKTDQAVAAYQEAVALRPNHAAALTALGSALRIQGNYEAAIACYKRIIALDSNCAKAHGSIGTVLSHQGKFEDAIAAFDRALAIDPDHAEAEFGRALINLLLGNFAAGWRDYMRRPSARRAIRKYHKEALERDLSGKRLVVFREQGLGDEIFFLRFVPQLNTRGASIAYCADPKIAGMIARLPFIDRVLGPEDEPGSVDLVLSLGDLPHLLGMTDAREIPPSVEITALPERVAEMRARLAGLGPPPYIGATWHAGTQKLNHLSKIAPLERLAAALRPIGSTVVAIQRNPAVGEIEAFAGALGRPVHDLTALSEDLEGMLALVDLLDEYVCVSNTHFHLRAVRGHTCRVLIPNRPEFRWMASGTESPWFPGTRVYRQTAGNDWGPAFVGLERDLVAAWTAG